MQFDLVVVGGGAAGFFGAIQAASADATLRIAILERTSKVLTKVKVSGGGRCNVTHACYNPFTLSRHYPRGEKMLKSLFRSYHVENVVAWFASRGVALKTEADGRMFPVTDNSQTIIDCFLREASRLNIGVYRGVAITRIGNGDPFILHSADGRSWHASRVLVATGGHSNPDAYKWIAAAGHTIVPPVPSLFTFNDPDKKFSDLMGIAVPSGEIRLAGTKFSQQGPILITHWGLSGPAVIKLSAWAATYLHGQRYVFDALVNWTGESAQNCHAILSEAKVSRAKQKIHGHALFGVPVRLWVRLCELSGIQPARLWGDVSKGEMNRLVEHLVNTVIHVSGKTTFKEEFVTCGGIDLREVDATTMQSKQIPGLYFAGEVLNIDGETGGFNFQAAWTTAYLAGRHIGMLGEALPAGG